MDEVEVGATTVNKKGETSKNVDEVEIRAAFVKDIGWSASLADDG